MGDYLKYFLKTHPEVLMDEEDIERFKFYTASINKRGYVELYREGKVYRLHRLVMDAPIGIEVDHVHGNLLDNRKEKLRLATTAQNQANVGQRCDNTTGYKGLSWCKRGKKWKVQIRSQGRRYYIGMYRTKEAAAVAYNNAAKRLHGEFASLNVIPLA